MSLGISTSCYYPTETEEALKMIGKSGVKNAEIFFNATCELKNSFIDILLDITEEYGMNITSIHPTYSLAESFLFFSDYERRYREGLDNYRRYAEISARLGAKYIIMHGGKPNGILSDEEYCQRYFDINRATKENGAYVLQENVVRYRAGDIEFLKSMKEILGDDAMFCVDIKQSIRCGYTPYDIIKILGKNIKHFHISDHSYAGDCLLPGNGGFDFKELFSVMKSLEYDGAYIAEVYKDAYKNPDEIISSFKDLSSLY